MRRLLPVRALSLACHREFSTFPRDAGATYLVGGNLAHVVGPKTPELKQDTVWGVFERAASDYGSHDALRVCEGAKIKVHWSYSELQRNAIALANGLHLRGLRKGDRLGVWLPNCSEWLLLQLATAKLGIILVNINPAYRLLEMEYALNLVECRALVMTPTLAKSNNLELIYELLPALKTGGKGGEEFCHERVAGLRDVITIGRDRFEGILSFDDLLTSGDIAEVETSKDEPINIQFTSGTTGNPKGATLTHSNIVNNAFLVAQAQILTDRDKVCVPVPLYHCFGMVMGNLGAITHGACIVYPAEIFNPQKTLECVETNQCTSLYGVPAMFAAELNLAAKYDLSSLRTGIMAGSPCPIETMKRVMKEMHMTDVTIAYGMTETSPVSWQSRVDDSVEKRCGTVGRVMPQTECKIVREDGITASIDEPGEVWTRGYLVMRGYFNDSNQTREAVSEDGWMRTGDVGSIDEEGYLSIGGRIKDVIIRGGENLFPKEIEDFLHALPMVQEAEVVGVPDEKYGEAVCAFIIPTQEYQRLEGSKVGSKIRADLEGKISHFKIPKYILLRDSFDDVKTFTNKHMKYKLREIARSHIASLGSVY